MSQLDLIASASATNDDRSSDSDEDYNAENSINQNRNALSGGPIAVAGTSNGSAIKATLSNHHGSPSVESSTTSSTSTPMSSFSEEKMRRKLQFFFMNPIEKWQARRRFPFKFAIQLAKIVLITMQLCLFAHFRYNHVNYTWNNKVSFSHLFLRGWDPVYEIPTYPPATGPLSVYIQDDFFETIDYAISGYQNLNSTVGVYSYPNEDNTMPPLKFCISEYKQGIIYGFNESYVFDSEIIQHCLDLADNVTVMKSKDYLAMKNVTINFSSFVMASLDFSIKTVNFKVAGPKSSPDCYRFDIQILFDNSNHDGQIVLALDADAVRLNCQGDVQYITDSAIDAILRSALNVFVILICSVSLVLCARAIYRAQLLRSQTVRFFRITYNRELSRDGKLEFVNFWYIMIIFNDFLLILGSALKEEIERKNLLADEWNICSLLLGIGNLLVWFGVLRYMGFFKTYNVIILTLKRAAPNICRFSICALMIYAGFTFCGWIVLGPYHMKFRSLAITIECLFALINGDDIFATFTTMQSKSTLLWWFSRIYLYSFISLFIYVVLSVCISVIMDAYDTIKKYYKDGFPVNDLKAFMGQTDVNDFTSGAFRAEEESEETGSFIDILQSIFCWNHTAQVKGPTGYTTLSNKPAA